MKDLTDYVINYEGTKEFYVDVHDLDGNRLWGGGESFKFVIDGVEYIGWSEIEDPMHEVSYVNVENVRHLEA